MRLSPGYPILTPRLSLAPLTVSDVDALLTYRGRADVCRYLPFPPMTREVLLARLSTDLGRTEISGEGQALTLGVRRRDSGALIGDVVLFLRSVEHAAGELGYVFTPEVAGQGFATEACREVLRLGFGDLGLHRVSARLDARNDPSARLAERLGMRREAHFVEDEMFKGEWSDTVVYGVLGREWRVSSGEPGSAGRGQWVIRAVQDQDLAELLDFWRVAAENEGRPADSVDAVRRLLRRDPEALVAAWSKDRIVGSVISGWDGWRYHLYRLAVHPDVRRRGLAHALLDHAEQRLRDLGATRIDAMVRDGNDLGHSVWSARGYAPQADWRRWVKSV